MSVIAVCTPTRDMVHALFAFDMITAISTHVATTPDTVVPLFAPGTILASQRAQLVLAARRENADYVLFVDSDMRVPANLIQQMLDRMSPEVLVLAANCAKRKMPTGPTAGDCDEVGKKTPIYSMPGDTGLDIVDVCGTGVMMCDMQLFDDIGAPWFATPWVTEANNYMGEDVYFCRLLKKHGIPLFIDHDLSKQIGHIGAFEFRHEHTWAVREAEEAKQERLVVLA